MSTLQDYADATLDEIGMPSLKQPLKNVFEAFDANGWERPKIVNGKKVWPQNLVIRNLTSAGLEEGIPFEFYDPATGRFAFDVTGPFGPNAISSADPETDLISVSVDGSLVVVQSHRTYIVGSRNKDAVAGDDISAALFPAATVAAAAERLRDAFGKAAALAAALEAIEAAAGKNRLPN